MAAPADSALPRARLRPLPQPPLDAITVYNTATHCYLLATDSLQRDYHLLTCRKHSLEEAAANFVNVSAASSTYLNANSNSNNPVSESDYDERGGNGGGGTFSSSTANTPSQQQQSPFCSLDDLHDYTTYAVYSPTEAASLVEALQREHAAAMHILEAVALVGAVRFTEGYYLVLVTQRRLAGCLGVHRLFEAAQVELVSLLLDTDWVAAQAHTQRQQQQQQQQRRTHEMNGLSAGINGSDSLSSSGAAAFQRKQPPSSYRKHNSSATAAAAAYLFQRRSLEELYRQQFLSSLSRASSFFYSHSYDLTNTLQRNMLADGATAAAAMPSDTLHQPRMQYVWNEYLLEPWQLPESAADVHDADDANTEERRRSTSAFSSDGEGDSEAGDEHQRQHERDAASARDGPGCGAAVPFVPQYPPSFARWRTFLIHGFITQRTVVVRRPDFHTLLLTLIARVSKASAGVRYLRRGINSDGQVANHVEVEQIVSDESAWSAGFTDGALSSYVQLRGSVPLRWYHPPTASRLLPKPPIVLGPPDAEWSTTCLHFQELLRQYGGPILVHDLLKRKGHHTRESALGDAYRAAAQALTAAVTRAAVAAADSAAVHETHEGGAQGLSDATHQRDRSFIESLRSADVLQYESTDLRDLGPLAWNTMTAIAEHHFDQVHCFVCRRQRHEEHESPDLQNAQQAQQQQQQQQLMFADVDTASFGISPPATPPLPTRDYATSNDDACPSVAVQIQCGVVRSNCLDCIDRTNLGQLFHGLHALGEQLAGLGLLHHAADLRDSPAVTELLLEMYLAMGDALATQYGGSAQVGAGVLHRGAGWDQLMGVKRLYNNVMGDRDKQEAIKLLLGRTQPHPRRHSRARNTAMHSPGQVLPFALQQTALTSSASTSLNASVTSATSGVVEAAAAAARASSSNHSFHSPLNAHANSPLSNTSISARGQPHNANASALVPATPSASSFFSNVVHAATRWWGAATGASSASATAAATAAVEALRAAQHAAAEAEAEPDFYEQVTRGPQLPPAGLLATWWVRPLKDFTAWYAACGVKVADTDRVRAAAAVAAATAAPDTMHSCADAGEFSESARGCKGEFQVATPPPSSPFQAASVKSAARSSAAPTSTTTATTAAAAATATSRHLSPAAMPADAFAQHLFAADQAAQQQWLHFVARWERQACLAPTSATPHFAPAPQPQRGPVSGAGIHSVAGGTPLPTPSGAALCNTSSSGGGSGAASAIASPLPGLDLRNFFARGGQLDGAGVAGGAVTLSAAAAGSILRPSESAWAMDELSSSAGLMAASAGMGGGAVLSRDTGAMLREGSLGALTSGGPVAARSAAAGMETSSLFAPFSLTLTPSLFVDPWIVLRTTTHTLPVDAASPISPARRGVSSTTPPVDWSGGSVPTNASAASASLQLLYSWRQEGRERSGVEAPQQHRGADLKLKKVEGNQQQQHQPWPQESSTALSVMRQVFGHVPSHVTAIAASGAMSTNTTSNGSEAWVRQPWHCPEDPHNHGTFPRAVRNSVFARQEAALAELASCETMWVAQNDFEAARASKATKSAGRPGDKPTSSAAEPRRGTWRSPSAHATKSTFSLGETKRNTTTMTTGTAHPTTAPSSAALPVNTTAVEDERFAAALLQAAYGAAESWDTEEIVLALQRLLYPAVLSSAVQRLLRHSRVQPAISGSELLSVNAAQGTEVDAESVREYWRCRLSLAVEADGGAEHASGKTPQPRTKLLIVAARSKADAAALEVAAALLSRLCRVLRSAVTSSQRVAVPYTDTQSSRSSSTPAMPATPSPTALQVRFPVAPPHAAKPFYKLEREEESGFFGYHAYSGAGAKAAAETKEKTEESLTVAAVSPLLRGNGSDVPAAVQYALTSPDHPSLSEPMRRCWLLCRLLQPSFAACVLTPSLLHDLLQGLFDEVPSERSGCVCLTSSSNAMSSLPHRTRHHVRYTFALSPQSQAQVQQQLHHSQQRYQQEQQVRSQLAAGALAGSGGRSSNSDNGSGGGGGGGRSSAPPSATSSSATATLRNTPAAAPATTATTTVSGSAGVSAMHIPATLEVKCCCTALELYRWCAQFRQRCRGAHAREKAHVRHDVERGTATGRGDAPPHEHQQQQGEDEQHPMQPHLHVPSATAALPPRRESDEEAAEASWRLLWWAVENSLVVPVVRRAEQATLEILADETALFCVVADVPRVALNVERRGRGEVWRTTRTLPLSQKERDSYTSRTGVGDVLSGLPCACDGTASAIYGVPFASAFPIHRLTRRSALTDMVTLSETVASLGLVAATRVQEFFRDYAQHGWTRSSLKMGDGAAYLHGNKSSSGGVGSVGSAATVTLFAGAVTSAVEGCNTMAGTDSSSAAPSGAAAHAATSDASIAVTPADVIAHFSHLAEECLQSIQSVLVALQFMSLEALADHHALHAHISFFVNVYNAAYVVAWLTNVKELISSAAAAAERLRGSVEARGVPQAARLASGANAGASPSAGGSTLRTIDLFALPTLCNTSIACFMHVYGVAIGHVFLSLAEIKYGILGGNRAPPYRDTPLWTSSLNRAGQSAFAEPPRTAPPPTAERAEQYSSREDDVSWRWWSLVPLHLRAEIPEPARLTSLQQHPQLRAALHWRELSDVYAPKPPSSREQHTKRGHSLHRAATSTGEFPAPQTSHAPSHSQQQRQQQQQHHASSRDAGAAAAVAHPSDPASRTRQPSPASVAHASRKHNLAASSATVKAYDAAPLYPTTPDFESQRQRYNQLVEAWATDVVRHLPFRISLQLLDTYLPPPLFHLCPTVESSGKDEGLPGTAVHYSSGSGGGAGGASHAAASSGGAGAPYYENGGHARSAQLDAHLRLDVDTERVPWYLQPILNTLPLVHPALQSSKLGVVYGVAREDDGKADGTLMPQISPDANGVFLQPCRMWSSPSYYVVGGDGVNGEEAIAHAFQLLQSLSGSYLGLQGYRTARSSGSEGGAHGSGHAGSAVQQHLCAPLHHEEVLSQLHATEVAFRSALCSTDPQMFVGAASPSMTTTTTATTTTTSTSLAQQLQQYQQKRSSPPRFDYSGTTPYGSTNSLTSLPSRSPFGLSSTASCSAALHNAMKPLLYEWCRATDQGMESLSLLAKPGSQLRVLLKVVRLLEESFTSGEAVRRLQQTVEGKVE